MNVLSELDKEVGMGSYGTSTPPCSAIIRSSPEDFRVEEALSAELVSTSATTSGFPLYRIKKRNIDTFHLEARLSELLGSTVKFAGLKDKRAVAVQYASSKKAILNAPDIMEDQSFRAELVGYLPRPLSRASVRGNAFVITLRSCCDRVGANIEAAFDACRSRRLPNYYGLQRFGSGRALTHRVGRALVKGQFREAVEILVGTTEQDGELRHGQDVEARVAHALKKRPGDHVRAMRAVPIPLRRFYVQAYQSYLFNRTLSEAIDSGIDISALERGDNWGEVSSDGLGMGSVHGVKEPPTSGAVPLVQLVGFGFRDYHSRFDRAIKEVLEQEGTTAKQFFIKDMQEVSAEGGFRRPHLAAAMMSHLVVDGTAELSFTLARGGYATVLLREVIKPSDPRAAGFA